MNQESDRESHVRGILAASESILSEHFGAGVRLRAGDVYETAKSTVVRCHVAGPPRGTPPTFVAKRPKPDPQFPSAHRTSLLNEWAALELVGAVSGGGDAPAPLFYGGDAPAGVLVMEDLGEDDGASTAALVHGVDPERAEESLVELASLTGRLHALAAGRHADYLRVRGRVNLPEGAHGLFMYPWPSARLRRSGAREVLGAAEAYRAVFESIGLRPLAGVWEEVSSVAVAVEDFPGPFLTLCQGDQNGPGGSVRSAGRQRLYDFDCAGFRHALLEGVPARTSWGCIMRLPARVAPRLESAYRAELARAVPAAADDPVFYRALVEAAARWHVFQVLTRLEACLTQDAPRGPTTRRQQYLAWVDAFASMTEEFAHMRALGASARLMAARLRSHWPAEAHALPPYPAFRRETSRE